MSELQAIPAKPVYQVPEKRSCPGKIKLAVPVLKMMQFTEKFCAFSSLCHAVTIEN
jgi:hypothetical protein